MTTVTNLNRQSVRASVDGLVNDIPISACGNVEDLASVVDEVISIDQVLPADSPRIGGEDSEHARLLAELNCALPPIVVHRRTMRVIDGTHRLRAAVLRGEACIRAKFFEGSSEEAFVLAVQLNAWHGLPLSRAERSSAAARIIEAYPTWSNSRIASVCAISDKTVGAIRERSTSEFPRSKGRVGQDGRARPIDPVSGRLRAGEVLAKKPNTTLREVAQAAGISIGTAKDVRERLRQGHSVLPPRLAKANGEAVQTGPQKPTQASSPSSSSTPISIDRYMRLMATLKQDPSIRLAGTGRALLRLLDAHVIDDERQEHLISNVPLHCRDAVIDAARRCASFWTHLIDQLEAHTSR